MTEKERQVLQDVRNYTQDIILVPKPIISPLHRDNLEIIFKVQKEYPGFVVLIGELKADDTFNPHMSMVSWIPNWDFYGNSINYLLYDKMYNRFRLDLLFLPIKRT
jgi:hypothetical protein